MLDKDMLEGPVPQVLDQLTEAIISVNKEGVITYTNQRTLELLNVAEERLIHEHYSILFQFSESYEKYGVSIFKEALSGVRFEDQELHIHNNMGQKYILIAKVCPIFHDMSKGNKQDIIGAIGIFRDVTQARAREHKHQKWEERFRVAEKLAVVGEMAAGTAHEIKNPLTAIRGFLQYLKSRDVNEQKRQKYLGVIEKELSRLEGIVKEFLSIAQPMEAHREQGSATTTSLCRMFQRTLYFFKPQFQKEMVQLSVHCPGYPMRVKIHHDKLQQVCINLIKNAIEAMSRDVPEQDRQLTIYVAPDDSGECAKISIGDSGRGIPEDILNKLFSPFTTTKKSGTGLGLTVSMQIVQAYGGYLWAENKSDGKGATFHLELPLEAMDSNKVACQTTHPLCERILIK